MSSSAVQPILALISHPVSGNPTQYMIEKAFGHHRLDWRYLTVEVSPADLGDAVRGIRAMGFSGGHCGYPHKRAVLPLMNRLTDTAAMVGAVNLILREETGLLGDNTEGKGLLRSLQRVTDPAGKRIVLLGAGCIARAIGVELAAAGVAEITIVNRSEARAHQLADLLRIHLHASATAVVWQDDYQVPPECDVLINATSIGKEDDDARVPLAPECLRPEMIVADVTTNPPRTRLLREAAGCGCVTLDGLGMYIDQVALGMKLWTGMDPDRDVMREAIEEFLEL